MTPRKRGRRELQMTSHDPHRERYYPVEFTTALTLYRLQTAPIGASDREVRDAIPEMEGGER